MTNDGADANSITFVITSCGRFDLLDTCLTSFLAYNTAPISRYLLIEDSGDDNVHKVVANLNIPIEVIVNNPPLGQIAAIDRAYKTITTPFIFHCEDDWRFFRSEFIEESFLVLEHDPSITTVVCRRHGQNPAVDLIFENCPQQSIKDVAYRKPNPWLDEHWLGYSFNPGLRRLSDYQLLGSFSRWGHEIDASLYFKLRGRTIAILAEPACETLGEDRRLAKHSVNRSLRARLQWRQARWRFRLATLCGRR
jgi:hypothetical protein